MRKHPLTTDEIRAKRRAVYARHRARVLSGQVVRRLFVADKTKRCCLCKAFKPFSEFYKNPFRSDGAGTYCKPCHNKRSIENNKKRPEVARKSRLKNKFGLTIEEYNRMFVDQNGCCKICATHQSELKRRLSSDHCHTTGKVRGLLCHLCNYALGSARDNVAILQNMIEYLNGFTKANV